MSTLRNHLLSISAPSSVIPDLAQGGQNRQHLLAYARYFEALAGGFAAGLPGENNVVASQGSSSVAASRAYGIITLASLGGNAGIKLNGAMFTSISSGTPDTTLGQFTIAGTDAADATSLAAAINASTDAAIAGLVQAGNLATTITLTSVAVGDSVKINGIVFTAVSGVRPGRNDTFDVSGSDTADAQSLAAAINAHPVLGQQFLCTNSDGTTAPDSSAIYIRQLTGTTGLPLSDAASTIALGAGAGVAVALCVVSSKLPGVVGNLMTLEYIGVQASATATCVSVVVTDTLVINGVTLTAIKQRATGTLTAASAAAGDTCVVAGVTFTGKAGASGVGFPVGFSVDTSDTACAADLATQINAHPTVSLSVSATSSLGVVTIRALAAGTAGNAIVMAGTAVRLAFVGGSGVLTGGIAVANNQFDVSPGGTDTQVAADIVRCINASTTALVSSYVRATNLLGVVAIYSKLIGTIANATTLSSTGGTITCSATRLASGSIAQAEGVQASATVTLASVAAAATCTINGVVYTAVAGTPANDQFDQSGSDTADAASLCQCINNSTTAGSADIIATSAGAVVTVKARRGGISGNQITIAVSAGTMTISGSQTRLIGGLAPVTVVFTAARLANGVGGSGSSTMSFTA